MPRDNLVVRTTLRSSCSGGHSRFLAALLSCAVLSASSQSGGLRIRPEDPHQLRLSINNSKIHKITVVIEDSTGAPVPKAAVSFRLPDTAPTGLFRNGLRSEIGITDADGKVTLDSIQWSGATGTVPLRVTAAKDSRRAGVILNLVVSETSVSEPVLPASEAAISRQAPPTKRDRDLGKPIVLAAAIATKPQPTIPIDLQVPTYKPPSIWRSRWFFITLAAGGAVTAGYFGSKLITRSSLNSMKPIPPGSISQRPVVIGPPTITIDKP